MKTLKTENDLEKIICWMINLPYLFHTSENGIFILFLNINWTYSYPVCYKGFKYANRLDLNISDRRDVHK